ncbi:MAG: GEVED domain-containing protein [Bacteroidota bacterium]
MSTLINSNQKRVFAIAAQVLLFFCFSCLPLMAQNTDAIREQVRKKLNDVSAKEVEQNSELPTLESRVVRQSDLSSFLQSRQFTTNTPSISARADGKAPTLQARLEKSAAVGELTLISSIRTNPTSVRCNEEMTITAQVRNTGNEDFDSFVYAGLFDRTGNLLDVIEEYVVPNSIRPNQTTTLTFESVGLDYPTNGYQIAVFYFDSNAQSYSLIVEGSFFNPINLSISCSGTNDCETPEGLESDRQGYSFVSLDWSEVDGAIGYQTRYRRSDFSYWINGSVFDSPSVTWTNTNLCADYEFQVRVVCSDGTASAFSPSLFISTLGCDDLYCYADGRAGREWINQVELEDINNFSGRDFGYENYTDLSTQLLRGQNYTATLTPGGFANRASQNAYWRIWIDLNQDNDFLDAGEQVFQQIASNYTQVNASFNIPNAAESGETRMRITMSLDGYAEPCGRNSVRETEDYTLDIIGELPSLTVFPSSLSFGAEGGIATAEIASNVEWEITNFPDWISIDPLSGENDATLVIAADPNFSPIPNSGSIRIAGEGITRSIGVGQDAATNRCPVPQGITFAADYSYVIAAWERTGNDSLYEARIRPVGSIQWSEDGFVAPEIGAWRNLQPCTDYELQIRTVCDGNQSDYSPSVVFRTSGCGDPYCYSYSDGLLDYIDNVSLNTLDNASGLNLGYANYTDLSTNLERGETYDITLSPASFQGLQNVYWRVWIDLNGDNDFTDSGELLLQTASLNNRSTTQSISIPSSARLGNTRMRVSMSLSSGATPCSTGGFGEVEDYTVNIEGAAPTLVVEPASISLSCEGNSWDIEVSSNIEWRVSGMPEWLSVSATSGRNDGSFSITATRNPSTEVRRTTVVVSGSGITRIIRISQSGCAPSCAAPTGLKVELASQIAAIISWNASEGAVEYQSRARFVGNEAWTLGNITPILGDFWTGLSPCSQIEFQVRAICENDQVGAFSESIFLATEGCNEAYCYSSGFNLRYWIDGVQLNSIGNNSGLNIGYGDYTDLSTTLEKGASYQIFLTPGSFEEEGTVFWRVWIDYNQDNDFLDAGEKILEISNSLTTTVPRFFSIPSDALNGETRMRVSMSPDAYAAPCDISENLEVEDYTIRISGAAPSLSLSSNLLDFSEAGGTQGVQVTSNVFWTTSTDQTWLSVSPSGTGNGRMEISVEQNFDPSPREARIQVQGIGLANQQITVRQAAATPILACEVPNGLFLEDSGQPYVFYDWEAVEGALAYESRIRLVGADDWFIGGAFEFPGVIWANLLPCRDYEFQIRTICTDGEDSEFSASMFATTEGCDETYCFSYGIAWEDWINKVQLSLLGEDGNLEATGIENISGPDFGHGDYTDISTILQFGNEYQIVLEPRFYGVVKDVYWRVWIDFNQDGDFLDAGENVVSRENTNEFTEETVFDVPRGAKNGPTRMRVAMSTDGFPRACDIGGFREVEDYTVNVQGESPALELNRTAVDFGADGGIFSIKVSSNVNWRVTETTSWLSVSPSNGNGNNTFSIRASRNTSSADRDAVITVQGEGGVSPRRIEVSQAASVAETRLEVNTNGLSFNSGDDSKTFEIRSNTAWRIESSSNWLILSRSSGVGDARIEVRSRSNTGENSRSENISISTTDNSKSAEIAINQEGKGVNANAELTVESVIVDAASGCAEFEVRSNSPWEVINTGNDEWITSIDPMQGSRSSTVTVCYEENFSSQERTATFRFSNTVGFVAARLRQRGASTISVPDGLEEEVLALYPNPSKGAFTADLTLSKADYIVFKIMDLTGKIISEQSGQLVEGFNQVYFEHLLPSGVYTLAVFSSDRIIKQKRFVVE